MLRTVLQPENSLKPNIFNLHDISSPNLGVDKELLEKKNRLSIFIPKIL
ncbi:hypothetical protein BGP_4493 [Beggiatoa sp. PS]|nr:hypothetical protein BGP_4493 [Beggiatoa sp. PS]